MQNFDTVIAASAGNDIKCSQIEIKNDIVAEICPPWAVLKTLGTVFSKTDLPAGE